MYYDHATMMALKLGPWTELEAKPLHQPESRFLTHHMTHPDASAQTETTWWRRLLGRLRKEPTNDHLFHPLPHRPDKEGAV